MISPKMSGDVTAEAEAAPSPADRLTTQEKLLLSQAVYKLGAVAWPVVSKLLLEHPCCAGRGRELFSAEACEAYYIGLMTSIGMNVYVFSSFLYWTLC